MPSPISKLSFQFTYNEVYSADFRRFNLLFGNFDRLASHECGILNKFCGCLSISFDPALHRQSPSPLEHPAFHRFAKRFLAEVPALPFMAGLQEETLLVIVTASLKEVNIIEVAGAEARVAGRDEDYAEAVATMKDQATAWAKKADQTHQEISDLRVALQEYFNRPTLSRNW